jgi:hypothetical protein
LVKRNLTMNYGLRHEINGQMQDINNRLSAIDLSVAGGRFGRQRPRRKYFAVGAIARVADPVLM